MKKLTLAQLAADLACQNDMAEEFTYALSKDGTHLIAEQYDDDGVPQFIYRIHVTITKESA